MAMVMAVGGSTNAVLHLIAMARAVDVPLTIDDFQRVSDRVPLLADLKPSGKYVQEDLHRVGGTPARDEVPARARLAGRRLHDGHRQDAGREPRRRCRRSKPGQEIIQPLENPIKPRGHIRILRGNLAPTARSPRSPARKASASPARRRSSTPKRTCSPGSSSSEIAKGDVVVIRYEGPKGGPGMPEMLTPTSAIMGAGLGKDVALITDGRFSGGSHGFIVGHITPEAQDGGPIALVRERRPDHDRRRGVPVERGGERRRSWRARREAWTAPAPKATSGVLAKYVRLVRSASEGCVTD